MVKSSTPLILLAYGSTLSEDFAPKENAMMLRRGWFGCLVLVCLVAVGRVIPAVAKVTVLNVGSRAAALNSASGTEVWADI